MCLPSLSPLRHAEELLLAGAGITVMDKVLAGQEATFPLLCVIHPNVCDCIIIITQPVAPPLCSPRQHATRTQLQSAVLCWGGGGGGLEE